MSGRLKPIVLVPLGLVLWSGALLGSFVLDDRMYVVYNPEIRSLVNFLDLSGTRFFGYLSFALNYAIGGLNSFDFHLVNVIIHIVNALLVYGLVKATFKASFERCFTESNSGEEVPSLAAFLVSTVFLVHPLQTEAVTYISQRFTSLATLFYLASVLLYIRAAFTERSGGRKIRFRALYAASLLFTVLAMKTKEISFTIPFIIVLYDLILLRGRKKGGLLRVPFYLTLLIIPLTLLLPGSGAGVDEEIRRLQVSEAFGLSRYTYVLTQFRVIMTYIGLMLWPSNLHFHYDYRLSKSLFEPATFASFLFLTGLLGSSFYALLRSARKGDPFLRVYAVGILWFFTTLSVESFMVPIKDVIFVHRVYLPGIGFIMALSALLYRFLPVILAKRVTPLRTTLAALLIVVPPLSLSLHMRNIVWSDQLTLMNDEVRKAPENPSVYYVRGIAELDLGKYEDAIKDNTRAIELRPGFSEAYNNRGIALSALKRYDEAVRDFTAALEFNPAHYKARLNRAISYTAMGRLEPALNDYRKALETRPESTRNFLRSPVMAKIMAEVEDACSSKPLRGCEVLAALK